MTEKQKKHISDLISMFEKAITADTPVNMSSNDISSVEFICCPSNHGCTEKIPFCIEEKKAHSHTCGNFITDFRASPIADPIAGLTTKKSIDKSIMHILEEDISKIHSNMEETTDIFSKQVSASVYIQKNNKETVASNAKRVSFDFTPRIHEIIQNDSFSESSSEN